MSEGIGNEPPKSEPDQATLDRIKAFRDRISKLPEEKLDVETFTLTAKELQELLLSPQFGQRVVEAIQRTDADPSALSQKGMKFGQEFGFAVFRQIGDKLSPTDITPLFEGDERSIDLHFQTESYRRKAGSSGIQSLLFHTHPTGILDQFRDLLIKPSNTSAYGLFSGDFFSSADLEHFRRIAEQENITVIETVGAKDYRTKNGKLLLVSFNSFGSLASFDPRRIAEEPKQHPGSYLEIYRDHGLNATELKVNLGPGRPFVIREVAQASQILTARAA